ncbi:MAG: hypothetical protein AMQ22_00215 [Candidatus Methanofastidiosum methylothiophilum]|uniref:Uncharacterized protein n=1 Tax=Candidatus Methanofastidiosum methylothiophilum TaxID=1705564 RepID=A0A150ISD4_9EURY|nr:MAG: hypothetical protein APG11_00828 [Candidatus Methanofastidiosum methylthiophilus]KYC53544.1 MAG: hypothetical protein AMQ22_00215 [Candidatus Methanofastidiosum methylthiophilus]
MDNKTFMKIIEKQIALENEIMGVKGRDYTIGNSDRHYNFKLVAELVGITPEQVLMVYWLKHVLSILNHARGGNESEPVETRIADLRNYMLLYRGLVEEKKATKPIDHKTIPMESLEFCNECRGNCPGCNGKDNGDNVIEAGFIACDKEGNKIETE